MAVELLKERFNMKGQGNRQEFSIHKMELYILTLFLTEKYFISI